MVGHFPVAGWLHVSCGFLQHCMASASIGWDEIVDDSIRSKVQDVAEKLQAEGDPVCGHWPVDRQQPAVLWDDASSLAMGVSLEISGRVIEDAAWLHSPNDMSHINMAELEVAILGVNLCLRWGVTRFTLKTDSATVFR